MNLLGRLLMRLALFGGKLLAGLAGLVVAFFLIMTLAALPQLPAQQRAGVLWALGIATAVLFVGGMVWMYFHLRHLVRMEARPVHDFAILNRQTNDR